MQNSIFPKEIIRFSQEYHYFRFSRYSKAVYILVVMMVITSLLCLPLIMVDISVQSRGVIRSGTDPVSIQTPVTGLVESIHIYENKSVSKGDTLLHLVPKKISDQLRVLDEKISLHASYVDDLKNIVDEKGGRLKSDLFKSNFFQHKQKLNEYGLRIESTKKDFQRTQLLYEKEVIATADFEKKEFELNQLLKERDFYISQKKTEWHQQLFQYRSELQTLTDDRDQLKFEQRFYVVIAPVSGHISNFTGIQVGSFIFPNQTIATISPSDNLIVECYVSPNDIGYLRNDIRATFQVDAYDYNQWGLAYGKIIDISNQPYQDDGSVFFKVKCELFQDHLTLKSGYEGKLKNGLTLTSRFQVARRSLYDLLFDKADNWLNPRILTANH